MLESINPDGAPSSGWKALMLGNSEIPEDVRIPVGPVLVPLSVWKARRAELIHREYEHGWPLGVWIAAGESAAEIAADVDDFTVVAIQFDSSSSASSHAATRELRDQYGYSGKLYTLGEAPNAFETFPHVADTISVSDNLIRHMGLSN